MISYNKKGVEEIHERKIDAPRVKKLSINR
jgi:hypothetical protein